MLLILDKSVVFGLNNFEVDSLDRYFFQIVPPILTNEILADLSKESQKPSITDKIASHSYRISGNRGLPMRYQTILDNSLMGNKVPMEGKFFPAGEKMVRLKDGSIGTRIETPIEDETIFRWERKNFTEQEKYWAANWRRKAERRINPKIYTDKIAQAGIDFKVPQDDKELVETVDSLLHDRKLQGKLLALLAVQHDIAIEFQIKVINRWFKEGKPMIKNFAPYAFFCLRANFLWAIGLTNPELFKPDKNDRKDLEYCYYLPHCEIFSSKDNKHKRLVPFLLKPNQTFVDGDELKADLRKLSEKWDKLSREEKIEYHSERGSAPPENEDSIVFQLWKKHRGKISKPMPLEITNMKLIDSSLPKQEQVEFTLGEFLQSVSERMKNADNMSPAEIEKLRNIHGENNPATIVSRTTQISRERALKLHPQLKDSDLD